jgi:hypothetical protein
MIREKWGWVVQYYHPAYGWMRRPGEMHEWHSTAMVEALREERVVGGAQMWRTVLEVVEEDDYVGSE